MARKRPHARRLLFALLMLVLIALLLEINRWLPGGLPGGGGDGGFRERDTAAAGTEDPGESPGDAGPLALTPAGQEPPPAVARGSVVVQVRSADGAWLDYRIGAGGAATERPRGKQDGTHEVSAKRALSGELRVRTQDRGVAHDPQALGAEDGPWVVVMPTAAAKVAGRADRVILDVPGLDGAFAKLETEDVSGTRGQLALESGRRVTLPSTRRPQRVRTAATDSRPPGPWRWVHPRDGSEQSLLPPSLRRLSMGDGLDQPGALQEIFGPDGAPVPFTTAPGAEAGVVYVEAPADAELVGRFRIDGADQLVPFWDGFAGLAKGLTKHRTVLVRMTGPDGKPARNAQVVANWPQSLPGMTIPERLRLHSVARPTKTPGEYELRLPSRGNAHLVAAMDGAEAVGIQVPHQHALKEVSLPKGRTVVCSIRTSGGKLIPGASVYSEERARNERVVRHAVSDAAGRAALQGLSAEPVAVYAKAPGHGWARVIVQPGAPTATLTLPPAAPLRLLVSSPNGRPLRGVSVDVDPESDDTKVILPPAPGALLVPHTAPAPGEGAVSASGGTTDDRGALTIPDLPVGLYTLRLHLDGMQAEVIRKVEPGPRTWFLTLVPKD